MVIGSGAGLALAATQDINGVKVEDTAEVRGTKLALNGAGTRYRLIAKVMHLCMW